MSDFEGGSFGSRPEMYGVGEARRRFPDPGDCPNGCGCRRNTNDPDRNDCACDGPCTMDATW